MIYKEHFSQKKRNRAISITNIAINKIPLTTISGFSPEQNQYMQNVHKILLSLAKELNEENHTDKMEVGILIDLHKWNYWIIPGRRECEVEIKNNIDALYQMRYGGKNQFLFMHNHPSTGTFSGEDFKTFCQNESLYMMSVVGNDGSVYILQKQSNFDNSALARYAEIADFYSKLGYKDNGTRAIKYILKNATRYGLLYMKGRKWK